MKIGGRHILRRLLATNKEDCEHGAAAERHLDVTWKGRDPPHGSTINHAIAAHSQ